MMNLKILIAVIFGGLVVYTFPSVSTLGSSHLTEVQVLGERHVAVFDCNGTRATEFRTDTDYNERFINPPKRGEQPTPPTREGCKWVESQRTLVFNTPDGFIHENEYAETNENGVDRVFFVFNGEFENLPKEKVLKIQGIQL